MQLNQGTAIDRLVSLGMEDMPVMEYRPQRCIIDKDWFKKYSVLRRQFLESLSDSVEEIAFMNLSQDELMNIITGRTAPENTSIRFRIPLVWGGKLEIDNMFMCLTFPHSHNMDRFIIEQSDASVVFLPNPAKKIYVSTHLGGGGAGGNAASDRLSWAAMNYVQSNRGNE